VAAPTAFLGTFAQTDRGAVGYVTFGRDITGPGGLPDGVEDLYANGSDAHDVRVFDGQTGAFARTLWTSPPVYYDDLVFGPDGNLYVGSAGNEILRYDFTTGTVSPFVSNLDGPIAFGPDGNLYVSSGNSVVRRDRETGQLSTFIDFPSAGVFGYAFDMEFRPDGYLYVLEGDSSFGALQPRVVRFDGTTGLLHDEFVTRGSGGLKDVWGLTFGPDGDLYLANNSAPQSVLRYDGRTGAFLGAIGGGGMDHPFDVAFGTDADGDGRPEMYVSDINTGSVLRFAGPLTEELVNGQPTTQLPVTVLDAVTATYSS